MKFKVYTIIVLALLCLKSSFLNAQDQIDTTPYATLVSAYFDENKMKYGFEDEDTASIYLTDEVFSASTGMTHLYLNQAFQGKRIFNAISSLAIRNDEVFYYANRFETAITGKVNASTPSITPQDAIQRVVTEFQLGMPSSLQILGVEGFKFTFGNAGISLYDIPVELVYAKVDGELHLAWDLTIYKPDNSNWWSVRVDALDGSIIQANDMILTCQFETPHSHSAEAHIEHHNANFFNQVTASSSLLVDGSSYNVYPLPVESPNHGSRQLVTNPADPVASPFGWHDTDGVTGPEYTITRGNNVIAKEDTDGNNEFGGIGFSPEGTSSLTFDFPLDFNLSPFDYQEAAITHLFYVNNMMHDIWFNHGFDEQSGNFQDFNYTGIPGDGDFVIADAQDGSGFNNANFGTPPDGLNPRMQMFLWAPPGESGFDRLEILNGSLTGEYPALGAGFGPDLSPTNPVTGILRLPVDGTGDVNDACETTINSNALNNNIAVIRRGGCEFGTKVLRAQNAGAIGAIIVNNVPGNVILMGGGVDGGSVTIPSVMVNQSFGEALIAAIAGGQTITGSLLGPDLANFIDGDFDSGIVAHEYGHGISNRLTGGRNTASCLFNNEQMGEGWSDWFGLMITMEPSDIPEDIRGIGTFAISQPTNGGGIRPAPYSTDTAINSFTFDASNTLAQPHGIGFVWATILWDLTWAYIDKYGFDPDLNNGTGGNNRVMQLVIDGLKFQPCEPGFVDGRDALLAADFATTGGADQCLIWEVFALRGLGYNATQGSSLDRSDQIEDFNIPPRNDPSLNNCSSLSTEEVIQNVVSVYPNPTQTELSIQTPQNLGAVTLTLIDINGRVVFKDNLELFNSYTFSTANLKSGLYILNIKGDSIDYNEKIIKN